MQKQAKMGLDPSVDQGFRFNLLIYLRDPKYIH